ncbi:MAG: hypothetical protein NTX45_01295 [Proteobacteria bacterium]|nr:hypothetical protein [Pseudomonadota bacterium]
MPIDKATGEKTCINGCGLLTQAKPSMAEFLSHIAASAMRHGQRGVEITTDVGFMFEIWVCPICRYIELYDFELGDIDG